MLTLKSLSAFVLGHYAHKSVFFVTDMLTHLFRPWDAPTKKKKYEMEMLISQ